MTIQERIRQVRQKNNLTMEEFGKRIGIKKNSISLIESGKNNPSEQTILSICREFNINEEWLRTGNGTATKSSDTVDITRLLQDRGATELELKILQAYFELDKPLREKLMNKLVEITASLPQTATVSPGEADAEALYESSSGFVRKTDSSASSTTDATDSDESIA